MTEKLHQSVPSPLSTKRCGANTAGAALPREALVLLLFRMPGQSELPGRPRGVNLASRPVARRLGWVARASQARQVARRVRDEMSPSLGPSSGRNPVNLGRAASEGKASPSQWCSQSQGCLGPRVYSRPSIAGHYTCVVATH